MYQLTFFYIFIGVSISWNHHCRIRLRNASAINLLGVAHRLDLYDFGTQGDIYFDFVHSFDSIFQIAGFNFFLNSFHRIGFSFMYVIFFDRDAAIVRNK